MRSVPGIRPAPCATLLILAAVLGSTTDGAAFQVWRHSQMTGDVMTSQGITGHALSLIQQGSRKPDLDGCFSGCYCPGFVPGCNPPPNEVLALSPFHFDNNTLAEGRAHVEATMQMARDTLARYLAASPTNSTQRRNLGVAWINFGVALHAIQDFYAHSTWVENNRDLIRIGGSIDDAPLWNGENNWGTGSTVVDGVTVSGVQTGYERLPVPEGSVSHGQLNKDNPLTAQGQIAINRIFPFGLIGTYYQIASGQSPDGGPYTNLGLAPRHTIHAWTCLGGSGCAIYQLPEAGTTRGPGWPAASEAVLDLNALVAWTNADAEIGEAVQFMDSVWAAANPDSPLTFPNGLFDEDGWPLPLTTSVEDPVDPRAALPMTLAPNPTRGPVSIRFRLPDRGRVQLEIFDALGRRVARLVDAVMDPGWNEVTWNGMHSAGRAVPSGHYLCRLSAGGTVTRCRVVQTR